MLILILLFMLGIYALGYAFLWKHRTQIGGGLGRFNSEKWGMEDEDQEYHD